MNGDDEPESEVEQKKLKVIPLRACDDEADCVYLLDDAHLLSNSRFSTPDGKQYGSGQLLSDFFDFAELGKRARKVIFFGDPYQIQRGGSEGAVLLGDFQKSRELKHQSLELTQLIDTTGGSAKLTNAVKLVTAIRAQKFAALELETDEGFRVLDKKDAANKMVDHFQADPSSVWYLAETHGQANALTQWIRERLHGKKLLDTMEVGDPVTLVLGRQRDSDRDAIVQVSVRSDGASWDCTDSGKGLVTREAADDRRAKVFVDRDLEVGIDGEAWIGSHSPKVGEGVRFRVTENRKTGRRDLFAVEPGPRPDADVKMTTGNLKRNPKGFAFVDDAFVPPFMVETVPPEVDTVVAVLVYAKHPKEDRYGWRAVAISAA